MQPSWSKQRRNYFLHSIEIRSIHFFSLEPIDGNWGIWSSWGACSATCDNGTRRRTRKCDSPAPKPGGKDCAGDDHEDKECEEMISCDVGKYEISRFKSERFMMEGPKEIMARHSGAILFSRVCLIFH